MGAQHMLAATLEVLRRRFGYRLRTGSRVAGWVAPHLPGYFETEIVPGIRVSLDLRQEVERATWWSGPHYEAPTPEIVRAWLVGADRFFDLGANYGYFSYLALGYSTAEVYAFEPIPALIDRMRSAKEANRLERFHPQELGISDVAAEIDFCLMEAETSWSTFAPLPGLTPDRLIRARVVPFDAWRAEQGIELPARPSWVAKLDVEGYETRALHGMADSLAAHAFAGLAIELNEPLLAACGSSVAEVRNIMAGHRYREMSPPGRDLSMNAFFRPHTAQRDERA